MFRHMLSGKYLSFNRNFANKGELFLSSSDQDNREFMLGPLYKCQTINN